MIDHIKKSLVFLITQVTVKKVSLNICKENGNLKIILTYLRMEKEERNISEILVTYQL